MKTDHDLYDDVSKSTGGTTGDRVDPEKLDDVAQHYNAVPETGVQERTNSRIFYLRNFNNWVKSMIIGDVVIMRNLKTRGQSGNRGLSVLDLCCGKGGDLLKWKKMERVSHLVCTDIADISLEQCEKRYDAMARHDKQIFTCEFIHGDATKIRLKDMYEHQDTTFDICSCQFALHYSFISEPQVKNLLRNACECLKPGGYFVGTIPNAEQLVYLARQNSTLSFSNEVCSFQFEQIDSSGNNDIPLFGAKYHFNLDKVVNLPEYLVYFPLLIEMLKEFDMDLVYFKPFPEIVKDKASGEGKNLLMRMKGLEQYPSSSDNMDLASKEKSQYEYAERKIREMKNNNERSKTIMGTLSKAEWEVVCMYAAFVFRKKEQAKATSVK